MTSLHVRTDKGLKKDAQRILAKLGLDLSTAVNLFLVQVKRRKGIPFPLDTEYDLTPAQEQALLRDLHEARKSRKTYASAADAHRAILHTSRSRTATAARTVSSCPSSTVATCAAS
jgi:DNA-damage-inducible protein J